MPTAVTQRIAVETAKGLLAARSGGPGISLDPLPEPRGMSRASVAF